MKLYVLILTLLALACTAKLKLPENFSATFQIQNRNSNQKYFGIMTKENKKENLSIKAQVFTNEKTTVKYHNGKMINVHTIEGEPFIECVNKNDVPPMNEFEIIIKEAKLLPKEDETFDDLISKCKDDKWLISYGGEPFVLCQERKTKRIKSIISQFININILTFSITKHPNLDVEKIKSCQDVKHLNEKMYKRNLKKPWFNKQSSCKNKKIKNEKKCKTMKIMKEEKEGKICIFLHGIGNAKSLEPSDEYSDYWGDIHLNTPQCKIRKFIRSETKFRGWDNQELQKEYCKLALYGQNYTNIIKDKILFVHSMGNLILAAAIKNRFCEVDTATTKWYDLNGPMMGSQAASFLLNICNGTGYQDKVYRFIAEVGGYCYVEKEVPYPAYDTLAIQRRNEFIPLLGIAKSRISGILCGISSYGLQTRYGIALYLLGKLVGYPEDHDGMVAYSSCHMGLHDKFEATFESDFYLSTINHADGTARNGDGWWGVDRRPIEWIRTRKHF